MRAALTARNRWLIVSAGAVALAGLAGTACGDATPPPKPPTGGHARTTDSVPARGQHVGAGAFRSTGMSYDEALSIPEDLDAVKKEPELSNAQLSQPLKDAAFLGACSAPDDTKVTLRVVIVDGRAVGVSVRLTPDDATVAECIDKAVREMSWPRNRRRNSMTTTY